LLRRTHPPAPRETHEVTDPQIHGSSTSAFQAAFDLLSEHHNLPIFTRPSGDGSHAAAAAAAGMEDEALASFWRKKAGFSGF